MARLWTVKLETASRAAGLAGRMMMGDCCGHPQVLHCFPPPMAKRQGQGSSPILQSQGLRGRNKLGNITKIQLKVTNDKFPSKRGWDAMPKKSNKNSTRATFLSANGMSQSRCCLLTAPSAGGGGCCRAAGPIAALSPLPDSPALTFPPVLPAHAATAPKAPSKSVNVQTSS